MICNFNQLAGKLQSSARLRNTHYPIDQNFFCEFSVAYFEEETS